MPIWVGDLLRFFVKPLGILIAWWILDKAFRVSMKRFFSTVQEGLDQEKFTRKMHTLGHITHQVGRLVIAVFMILTLVGSLGVDLRPILAGVGLVGLGLSLAAQNILRDFLNGLFVVLEDHYYVGDIVTIGQATGTVERFTLRTTQLRNLDGQLVIIPNGSINEVTNHTKEWSMAKIELAVSRKADIRKALDLMRECAENVAKESGSLLEDPVIQGIIDFRDGNAVLRALLRTQPGKQWEIGMRYRLSIKEAFDAAGIPFSVPEREISVSFPETFRGTSRMA